MHQHTLTVTAGVIIQCVSEREEIDEVERIRVILEAEKHLNGLPDFRVREHAIACQIKMHLEHKRIGYTYEPIKR